MTENQVNKQELRQSAMTDPEVLEALRREFEFRNRARRILAEQGGETDLEVLKGIEETITLEEMMQKAEAVAA